MSLVRWKAVALHCTSQGIPDGLPRPRWPRRSDWLPLPRKISRPKHGFRSIRAGVALTPSPDDVQDKEVLFSQTLPLKRSNKVEGKITIRLDQAEAEKNGSKWRLTVGCNLDGKWTLHWGVNYCDEIGSDWDQPPPEMRPPGSVSIKDYAIETPLRKVPSTLEGQILHEVHIEFDSNTPIAAIHFVLKEEETGSWFQHKGRDFEISFMNYNEEDNVIGGKQGLGKWSGALNQISNLLLKADGSTFTQEDAAIKDRNMVKQKRQIAHFYEEFPIVKEEFFPNYMTVSVRRSNDADKKFVKFETDLPGDVIVHWGVCKDDGGKWEVPPTPHPPATTVFRHRALQTLLQIGCMRVHQHLGYVPYGIHGRKDEKCNESRCNRFHPCIFHLFYRGLHPTPNADGLGSWGVFLVDKETSGLVFVLKLNECTWLNNMGSDFYVPIESDILRLESESLEASDPENRSLPMKVSKEMEEAAPYTEEIISEIRSLVTDISSEKSKPTTTKETQENILQEIEKLAAEAYSIFRTSPGSAPAPDDESKPSVKVCSGTGSGHEILCQGFNWESQKSGRWYAELSEKTKQLSSLGFTVVWLPPPTASVSPEGYMPTDLYNLSSRYGNIEELKGLVNKFHEAGIKVLGDVVLNHRCAHYQNKNGVWNIFGGRLNWDDRAVVGDDPHFQGRGNKSSGDNFHAAPNIDHSQDFVRRDIKGWLNWLRQEVGYDGWRLDFVRGFWGGYVKDYLEASEPYFAVGEFWDSLSYTYGEMDHNQDAHRQRIVDWINATNGYAGAFDVTTKGILHSALERCEYWRLSDQNGKPPGVVGWWPSRAVTFIENHDTGSTQGHWRFPSGKEMQGYAYILTHPGTPSVFYDHIFSHYQQEISKLISLRGKNQIHCRSTVKIIKAERDHYAAEIDEKVVLKIGPGHFEPHNGHKNWVLAAEGQDYKVWETS